MSTEAMMEKTPSESKLEDTEEKKEQLQETGQPEASDEKSHERTAEKKERYEQLIARHGVPDQEKFIHKREQLYMMVEQILSDAFISKVIDYPSQTIDRLRMAAFLTGEDYILKQLSDQEPSEEQIREWIDDFIRSANVSSEIKPVSTSVEKSLDIMGRHMVRQQEIADAQITRLTEYIKQINEMERDKNERVIHNLREEHQKERENAQKRIDLLSEENFRLSMKIEETQEEAKKQAEEKKKESMVPLPAPENSGQTYPARETGMFAQRRRIREQKRREEFITSILGSGEFSKEQLTVINRVILKNFSLSQLQKICDPKVKPENMELLEAYYERRQTPKRQ